MVVSLVSLGWRVGIVVAAAVPLTLAAVFVIMLITGRVFDRITLGALILSLGLLVDDAIIAIEIMVVKMEEGMDRIEGRRLRLEPHRGAHAGRHAGHHHRPDAGRLRALHRRANMPATSSGSSAFALIASWVVAVVFTPYLGVQLLPDIKPVAGRPRGDLRDAPLSPAAPRWSPGRFAAKFLVAGAVVGRLLRSLSPAWRVVKQQFFPTSDRPELLVEVQMPEGTSIESDQRRRRQGRDLAASSSRRPRSSPAYIGQGAPRFFLAYNPELPDPSFAKIVVLTPDAEARDALKAAAARRASPTGWRPRRACA